VEGAGEEEENRFGSKIQLGAAIRIERTRVCGRRNNKCNLTRSRNEAAEC
jgi:hypothetical protein